MLIAAVWEVGRKSSKQKSHRIIRSCSRYTVVKMPLCSLKTNLLANKIPAGFHAKFVQLIASLLKKDVEKITVVVEPGLDMSRGGSTDPNCVCTIHSIGVFGPEKNKEYGSQIRDFIAENLSLPQKRIVIALHDLKPTDLA